MEKKDIINLSFIYLLLVLSANFGLSESNIIEIKNPIFTTKGIDENPYEIKAQVGLQNNNVLDLFVVEAKLKTEDNIWIYLNAERGSYDQSNGLIELNDNIVLYTENDKTLKSDKALIDTNKKIITLLNNVKFKDENIEINANKSVINNTLSTINYSGSVITKVSNVENN